jgi:hypothetical protein
MTTGPHIAVASSGLRPRLEHAGYVAATTELTGAVYRRERAGRMSIAVAAARAPSAARQSSAGSSLIWPITAGPAHRHRWREHPSVSSFFRLVQGLRRWPVRP